MIFLKKVIKILDERQLYGLMMVRLQSKVGYPAFLSVIIDIPKIVYYNRKKLESYLNSLIFTTRPKNRPKM